MNTTLPTALDFPGFDLADPIPAGGWAKRATVPASRMPSIAGEQRPCPTNGHLDRGRLGLTCTHHHPGRHVVVSLGRVLAVWPDTTTRADLLATGGAA